jgi:hypothetical protein
MGIPYGDPRGDRPALRRGDPLRGNGPTRIPHGDPLRGSPCLTAWRDRIPRGDRPGGTDPDPLRGNGSPGGIPRGDRLALRRGGTGSPGGILADWSRLDPL